MDSVVPNPSGQCVFMPDGSREEKAAIEPKLFSETKKYSLLFWSDDFEIYLQGVGEKESLFAMLKGKDNGLKKTLMNLWSLKKARLHHSLQRCFSCPFYFGIWRLLYAP